ncbi:hypothetical protein EDD36DRAFT_421587 [Exophiala viscosa]|uniref:Uncharacterized protein n=1 Tax=Exophiala viscosa TaxID=2486360 RepID=A0AAN6DQ39_9EURO|nr:hypothetical protein EDD36DRAFT_421587 [Exophiala viscosa]
MEGVQTESSFAAKASNHSERSANVVFQVRVVGNNHNTTPFTMVQASKARKRDELWDEVVAKVPIVMDERYIGTEQQAANPFHGSSPPLYLLQETCTTQSHRMLHTRWAVMAWENASEYSRWYQRNVNEGTSNTLKIEIHFQNNLVGNEEYFKHYDVLVDAGLGKVTLEYHLVAPMEVNPFIAVVPGTSEWFPERDAIDYLAAGGGCPICKEKAETLGLTSGRNGKKKKAKR